VAATTSSSGSNNKDENNDGDDNYKCRQYFLRHVAKYTEIQTTVDKKFRNKLNIFNLKIKL
jgi:hypothetical protein